MPIYRQNTAGKINNVYRGNNKLGGVYRQNASQRLWPSETVYFDGEIYNGSVGFFDIDLPPLTQFYWIITTPLSTNDMPLALYLDEQWGGGSYDFQLYMTDYSGGNGFYFIDDTSSFMGVICLPTFVNINHLYTGSTPNKNTEWGMIYCTGTENVKGFCDSVDSVTDTLRLKIYRP